MVAALSQATSPSAFPFSIPTMFAPMEGVTTPILRDEISKLGGVGVVCTEFIRISSEVIRPEHLRKQVAYRRPHCRRPLGTCTHGHVCIRVQARTRITIRVRSHRTSQSDRVPRVRDTACRWASRRLRVKQDTGMLSERRVAANSQSGESARVRRECNVWKSAPPT